VKSSCCEIKTCEKKPNDQFSLHSIHPSCETPRHARIACVPRRQGRPRSGARPRGGRDLHSLSSTSALSI
jgi:hypothetical protein